MLSSFGTDTFARYRVAWTFTARMSAKGSSVRDRDLEPHFLEKEWPQRELDGLVARETASGEKALLPIWHELDRSTLMKYSPPLADRLAGRSAEGVAALVEKILRVLKR
jgi:hypothetical protein